MSKESDEEIYMLIPKEFFELNRGGTQQEIKALQFGVKAALMLTAKQQAERDSSIKAVIDEYWVRSPNAFKKIRDIMEGKQ